MIVHLQGGGSYELLFSFVFREFIEYFTTRMSVINPNVIKLLHAVIQ